MVRRTRREALAGLASISSVSLAGCADVLDQVPAIGTSEEEELREQWQENDDYPDDEFRNYSLGRRDLARLTAVDGRVETTFGFHSEPIRLGVSEEYHRSVTLEVYFDSSKPVDVYLIPGDIRSEFYENPDLSEHEHVPEYSEFDTESYRAVLETTEEEELYTMVVTLADFQPPQTFQEEREFVQEREEAVLEGWMESAAYIPFEEYKENDAARSMYDFDTDETLFGDD